MFVGRGVELALLDALHTKVAVVGRPAAAYVSGPNGIGKSKLVQEWARRAREHSDRIVLVGQADEFVAGPLFAIRWALEDAELPTEFQSAQRRCLNAFTVASYRMSPDLGEAVGGFLAELARSFQLTLIIEDLHRADQATVRFLAEHLRESTVPILLIATARAGYSNATDIFHDEVRAQAPSGRGAVITLQGLSTSEISEQIGIGERSRAGEAARLYAATGGNPLLLSFLCSRSGVGSAVVPVEVAGGTDTDVYRGLQRRLAPTGRAHTHLGGYLALLDDISPEDVRIAGQLLGIPSGEVNVAVGQMVAQGLLVETDGGYSYVKPLVRAAFLGAMSLAERRTAHQGFATKLLARGHSESANPIRLASHLAGAGPPLSTQHREIILTAADQVKADEPLRAAEWFAALLRNGSLSEGQAAHCAAGQITCLVNGSKPTQAWDQCQWALVTFDKGARPSELEVAITRTALFRYDFTTVLDLTEGAQNPDLLAQRAMALMLCGQGVEAMNLTRKTGEQIATGVIVPSTLLLSVILVVLTLTGDAGSAMQVARRLMEIMPKASRVDRQGATNVLERCALHNQSIAALIDGEGASLERRRPQEDYLSGAAIHETTRALTLYVRGNWEELLETVPEDIDTMLHKGYPQAAALPAAILADVYRHRRQFDEASRAVSLIPWPVDATNSPFVDIVLTRLDVALGRKSTTEAVARLYKSHDELKRAGNNAFLGALIDELVSLLVELGRLSEARSIVGEALRCSALLEQPIFAAHVKLALGLSTGEWKPVQEALASARKANFPLLEARAQLLLGDLGRKPDANLAAAHRTLSDLGVQSLREQCERAMRQRAVPTPRGRSAADLLTPVESAIAREVVAGHTNREIAEKLGYSTKTVEMHLSRVYARTGHSGRVKLVKAVHSGLITLS